MDQHKNPDGTYDGVGVMADVTGLGREEVKSLWAQVRANGEKLRACPFHEFEKSAQTAPLRSVTLQKYVCRHCGGEINATAHHWYTLGRSHEKAARLLP